MTTTAEILDALLEYRTGFPGFRWNFPAVVGTPNANSGAGIGQGVSLTYSFPATLPAYDSAATYTDYAALTAAQATAARAVFAHYAGVTNITFTETAGTGNANIAIGKTSAGFAPGVAGYANFPSYGYTNDANSIISVSESGGGSAGDVWINLNGYGDAEYASGGFGYSTLLHEIGHSLGLKHPFEAPILPAALDNTGFTVMSYDAPAHASVVTVSGDQFSYSIGVREIQPTTLMVGDMLALQATYGANTGTRSGNDTYSWLAGERILQTLWDGGGNDTIDASNQTLANYISLVPGTYSSIGLRQTHAELMADFPSFSQAGIANSFADAVLYNGSNNLGIAYGAAIENAKGGSGNDSITGNDLGNNLAGNGGNDTLAGGPGADTLDGGSGADSMVGGDGSDVYYVDNALDVAVETIDDFAAGDDTVHATISYTLGFGIENLVQDGSANLNGTGNDGGNLITGNSGNNRLEGGAGLDVLEGGDGNDTLSGGTGADQLDGGNGVDTLDYSGVTSALTAELWAGSVANDGSGSADTFLNIENLTGGSGNDFLAGNFLANRIEGGAGNDQLFGYEGDDTLAGGTGSDTLNGGTGTDTLDYSAASTALSAELWSGTVANDGSGGIDTFTGFENLTGGSGNDFLAGNFFANRLEGGAGNDRLYGYEGDDTLAGGAGSDTLVGGTGTNTLDYSAVSASLTAELWAGTVANDGTGGTDTFANMQNLTGGTGNDFLAGNFFSNRLEGGAGNDQLYGYEGDDTLAGGAGNDTLVGGSGTDTLDYSAVTANLGAELWAGTVANDGSGGADTFFSFENLTGGAGNDFLAGNFLANRIEGGAGNDQLYSYEGDDTLFGGAGADTLAGGSGTDTLDYSAVTSNFIGELWRGSILNDGSGSTDVFLEMENIASGSGDDLLSGDFRDNRVAGNAGNDRLFGQEGNDTLAGGAGHDTLAGGTGIDQFVFDTLLNAATNLDTISDFAANTDQLVLDHLIFTTLAAGASLSGRLAANAGGTATDADEVILYNTATGALSYDADGNGNGAAIQFAVLGTHPSLSSADFAVI